jgi:purine-binding chemotaxis protein CheW
MSQMTADQLSTQLVVFSLGNEEYALPISDVQEIIRYTEPRAVASIVTWLQGIISLRGQIIPVCDLASRLGLESEPGEESKIVIVETSNGTAGVVVDNVEEVITIENAQFDEVAAVDNELVRAVAKVGDRLIILLDREGIFGGVDMAARTARAA